MGLQFVSEVKMIVALIARHQLNVCRVDFINDETKSAGKTNGTRCMYVYVMHSYLHSLKFTPGMRKQ